MPTRQAYRLQLAADLGGFGPRADGLAWATGGTGTTLIDTLNLKTALNVSERYQGAYLLRPTMPDADRVRLIDQGAYQAPTGVLTVDRNYTSPPTNLEPYELHQHGWEPWGELDTLLNQGLKLCMLPWQESYAPVVRTTGNYRQNLNARGEITATAGDGQLPWLKQSSWVTRIDLLPAARVGVQTLTQTGVSSGQFSLYFRGAQSALLNWDGSSSEWLTAIRSLVLPHLDSGFTMGRANPAGSYVATLTLMGGPLDQPPITVNPGTTNGTTTLVATSPPGDTVQLAGHLYQYGPDVVFHPNQHFASGDRLYVSGLARAYDLCRLNGSQAFGTQSGFRSFIDQADAQEAIPSVEMVSTAAQLYAWRRSPHLMETALEQRRVRNEADCLQLFLAYQHALLGDVPVSPSVTHEPGGAPFRYPLPISLGQDPLVHGAALPAVGQQ